MKYTQIPSDAFKEIQLNAGILLDSFTPSTQTIGNILGATSGGINFTATPTYKDYGEDIDNCPKNTMELKKLESWESKMSGKFITIAADTAKLLVGAGDIDSANASHVIPRNELLTTDFKDIWWVGDYSDINADGASSGKAGYCAIHLKNALSTSGFAIQSTDDGKGQFSFEFTGHYTMSDANSVPFEIYVVSGTTN